MIDAFLLLEQPRQRLGHWSQALAALDSQLAPPLAEVTAYYDPDGDLALLALRYDELALGDGGLAFVVEVALLAEIGMIQPAELSAGDRKRFLGERLARCTVEATGQRTAAGALAELVRKLRSKPTPRATSSQIADGIGSARLGSAPGWQRGLIDALPMRARGPETVRLPSTPPPIPVRSKSTRDDLPAVGKQPVPAVFEDDPIPMPRATRDLPRPPRAGSDAGEPYFPPSAPNTPDMIYARYLRSGRWVPIRIGSLSLRGAALLAGALPRTQDSVDVALSFGGHRALVRGAVAKVSTMTEATTSGAATFSVEFALDQAARRQLTALLTAARAAKVTIKPPPPRATRRFPVEWPVCLGTKRGAIRGDALDVSRGGMFVKPTQPLAVGATLNFSALLDDQAGPVAGRARVVRHVTDAEALACGLVAGYGLHVLDMGDADLPRWFAFLGRVEKRADRRVLIGASPARLAELQATLAAAGYAVTGGTDPGALVQLASTDARPVDAAMIDGSWLGDGGSASWFDPVFGPKCPVLDAAWRRTPGAGVHR